MTRKDPRYLKRLQTLARDIARLKWPQTEVETRVYGPVGLCNRYWFEFEHPTEGCFELNIEPQRHRRPGVRDFQGTSTEEYAEGTIGAMNGLNYPLMLPPQYGSLKWYLEFIRKAPPGPARVYELNAEVLRHSNPEFRGPPDD